MENTSKILVIGSTGNIGSLIANQLLEKGFQVRVSSRNPEKLTFKPGFEVVALDIDQPETYTNALKNIDKVFMYALGSKLPDFLMEAKEQRVKQVVLLSSGSVVDAGPDDFNANHHRQAEEAILKLEIPYTFLRPSVFAYNVLSAWKEQIKFTQTVKMAYPGSFASPIHEKDIADVAVMALTKEEYLGKELMLTGPESLTQAEEVKTIADVLGVPLKTVELSPEEALKISAQFIPQAYAEMRINNLAKADGKPSLITNIVEQVTHHPARTFRQWVIDNVDSFK